MATGVTVQQMQSFQDNFASIGYVLMVDIFKFSSTVLNENPTTTLVYDYLPTFAELRNHIARSLGYMSDVSLQYRSARQFSKEFQDNVPIPYIGQVLSIVGRDRYWIEWNFERRDSLNNTTAGV